MVRTAPAGIDYAQVIVTGGGGGGGGAGGDGTNEMVAVVVLARQPSKCLQRLNSVFLNL